ncbi:MAG: Mbeg1-like protein, partial [Bacilli bacterium]
MIDEATLMLILSSLVYVEGCFLNPNQSVYDNVLAYYESSNFSNYKVSAGISKEQLLVLINTVLNNKELFQELIVYDYLSTSSNGSYLTITSPDQLIIIFKGTANDQEWIDNLDSTYLQKPLSSAQEFALEYYLKQIVQFNGSKSTILVAGHSKGGNKASLVTLLNNDVTRGYAFDGQGFNQVFHLQYQELIKLNKGKLLSYNNKYDYVNILMKQVDNKTYFLKSNLVFDYKKISNSILLQHAPFTMFKINNGVITSLNDQSKQSSIIKKVQLVLNYYYTYLSNEQWKMIATSIINTLIVDKNNKEQVKLDLNNLKAFILVSASYYASNTQKISLKTIFIKQALPYYENITKDYSNLALEEHLHFINQLNNQALIYKNESSSNHLDDYI